LLYSAKSRSFGGKIITPLVFTVGGIAAVLRLASAVESVYVVVVLSGIETR